MTVVLCVSLISFFSLFFLSRDDTAEYDSLCERRVAPVRHAHVGLPALGVRADVHVHEGLASAGPPRDLNQVLLVGITLQVTPGIHHLLVHVELEAA